MSAPLKSLRDLQKEALLAMMNLNNRDVSDSSAETGLTITEPVWKVLVYDKLGQDIISPLAKVNELREQGVTVHMPLYSDRQPIPDVPAIYFLRPTADNIRRLGDDFARHLYDSYYVNFSSSLPRPLLEELAQSAIAANAAANIAQVFDQYLNYVCLDNHIFSLQMDESYRALNDANASEASIESLIDEIVSCLFSVLVTMGVVPIIRCPRGNAAEVVANKLEARLRDHLLNTRANLFAGTNAPRSLSRPVLIILDRNLDLTTMLSHTWTYAPLVHDILDMKLDRVTVYNEENGHQKRKVFDIDPSDFFWKKHSMDPFPQVAEDVDVEINKYKQDVNEVTKSCGVSSLEEVNMSDFTGAKGLQAAISKLPELTERKRLLDMHMSIATNLLRAIQERQLDLLFAMEESVTKQTTATILEAINDPKKTAADKLRLFAIYFLTIEVSKEDLASFETALAGAGCNLAVVNYLKQVRAFSKMAAMANAPQATQQTSNDFLAKFTSIGTKLTEGLKDAGMSNHFETLVAGVKNLLPARRDTPVTRIVDALMESRDGPEADEYLYLDPRLPKKQQLTGKQQRNRTVFQEAIVFVIGGGNYLEAQNLMEYTQRSSVNRKRITYGSTEMVNPNAFLEQLEGLGAGNRSQ
ncbi:Sec1-like protein [Gaertneriomyces semiglobifer]|nr:Sec1-like protein [Gaertneriomyces semiglobifer]